MSQYAANILISARAILLERQPAAMEARRDKGDGLLGNSSAAVCPVQSFDEHAKQNFVSNMTFYEFNRILSGACAAFTILAMLVFMFIHATHFSKPNEQSKILRISIILPLYALISWISLEAPHTHVYLHPWLDFVQSISLSSFFLLMCEFVSPSEKQRDVFFAALSVKDKKSPTGTRDGLAWFRTRWILIFQYPVVSLLVSIFTDITEAAGVYCEFETNVHFAKLWLSIIGYISIGLAVVTVLKFYGLLKTHLAHHQPLAKLLSFKLIVGLTMLQNIIYLILGKAGQLNPTDTLTYADLFVGIPSMLTCLEMVLFTVFFYYAYSWRPYLVENQQDRIINGAGEAGIQYMPSYQGGPLGIYAFLYMLNPSEILQAMAFAVKMQAESKRGPRMGSSVGQNYSQEYAPLTDQASGNVTAPQRPAFSHPSYSETSYNPHAYSQQAYGHQAHNHGDYNQH